MKANKNISAYRRINRYIFYFYKIDRVEKLINLYLLCKVQLFGVTLSFPKLIYIFILFSNRGWGIDKLILKIENNILLRRPFYLIRTICFNWLPVIYLIVIILTYMDVLEVSVIKDNITESYILKKISMVHQWHEY